MTDGSVSEVVTKYSNFVSFPIFLNGRRLNTLQVSSNSSGFFSGLFHFVTDSAVVDLR